MGAAFGEERVRGRKRQVNRVKERWWNACREERLAVRLNTLKKKTDLIQRY